MFRKDSLILDKKDLGSRYPFVMQQRHHYNQIADPHDRLSKKQNNNFLIHKYTYLHGNFSSSRLSGTSRPFMSLLGSSRDLRRRLFGRSLLLSPWSAFTMRGISMEDLGKHIFGLRSQRAMLCNLRCLVLIGTWAFSSWNLFILNFLISYSLGFKMAEFANSFYASRKFSVIDEYYQ